MDGFFLFLFSSISKASSFDFFFLGFSFRTSSVCAFSANSSLLADTGVISSVTLGISFSTFSSFFSSLICKVTGISLSGISVAGGFFLIITFLGFASVCILANASLILTTSSVVRVLMWFFTMIPKSSRR